MFSKDFEKTLEQYVKFEDNKPVVDWSFVRKFSSAREGSYNESLNNALLDKLVELNVLSYSANNNYVINSLGIPLNPTLGICYLYFTNLEDAKKYKAEEYSGALYSVSIRRIEVVKE